MMTKITIKKNEISFGYSFDCIGFRFST